MKVLKKAKLYAGFFIFLAICSVIASGISEGSEIAINNPVSLWQENVLDHNAETVDIGRPLRKKKQQFPERLVRAQKDGARTEVFPTMPGFEKLTTQNFVNRYSSKANREWIEACLKNGEPYLSFIRHEIELRGLPPEILYLPIVESGFVINAKSKSGARGIWQFMQNSIHPYMKIDEWRDERLDFWKSTNAALSKLQAHHKEFGDWALALAAYNSGGGAIGRVIKETGIQDYWILADRKKLKTESISYVPKLLALYYIISNPRKFNLDICKREEEYSWAQIEIHQQVNLDLLAEYAGIDSAALRKANSELNSRVTPPGTYHLKVRENEKDLVQAVLENSDLKLLKHYIHTIKSGDTLYALALNYGVDVESILSQNPGLKARFLKLGEKIMIPALKDMPSKESGGTTARTESAKNTDTVPAGTWTVKQGDTLWSIARVYNINPEELARTNNMSTDDVLSVGKILRVP
ncbi:MAG: LysM peptidoglycan-binding domain-containing protein [Spirochaetaceae bacterium]|jgi:membrane-bound lytic murein transglycosylase D|nr:LysM peptidoglycan-binding domain-containing protein [Spirochaetaceae bacterium]